MGNLKGGWVPHDTRDEIVDYVRHWNERTKIAVCTLVVWLGIAQSKFSDWRTRYGKVNEHNGWIPRDHWLEDWEKQAILDFERQNSVEGYRRLTFMMLDADVVAVSPSSVYRVLRDGGPLGRSTNEALPEGNRLHSAAAAAPALARRRVVRQRPRHVLLPARRSSTATAVPSCIGKFARR